MSATFSQDNVKIANPVQVHVPDGYPADWRLVARNGFSRELILSLFWTVPLFTQANYVKPLIENA